MRRRSGNLVPGSGLCAFEHEKLEVLAVIVDWDTPFAIVILEHQRIIDADPGAPFNCCTARKFKDRPPKFCPCRKLLHVL